MYPVFLGYRLCIVDHFLSHPGNIDRFVTEFPGLSVVQYLQNHFPDPVRHLLYLVKRLGGPLFILAGQAGFQLIDPPVQGSQHPFNTMRHGTDHEPERSQMILELPDLGNIRGHFHHLGNLPQRIPDRCRPGQHVVVLAGF